MSRHRNKPRPAPFECPADAQQTTRRSGNMRLIKWVVTGAVLTGLSLPFAARAEGPEPKPAPPPPGERRAGPDDRGDPESRPQGRGPEGRRPQGGEGAPGNAGAQRMGPPPGQIIDEFRKIAKDLNLTDEQKTKVE